MFFNAKDKKGSLKKNKNNFLNVPNNPYDYTFYKMEVWE